MPTLTLYRAVTAFVALIFWVAIQLVAMPVSAETDHSRWAAHNPDETYSVDHKPLTDVFKVFGQARGSSVGFDYRAMKGRGVEFLSQYITYLENIPVSQLNRKEQLAYWLNLHNAGVIRTIAESGAPKSIEKLRGQPGAPGQAWADKIFTVEGVPLSLEEVEQDILLGQWRDPIILYGLCYGTKGSAALEPVAFTGANVEQNLRNSARKFVNSKKNVNAGKKGVKLSSLYIWNKDVLFNGDDTKVIAHLQKFAGRGLSPKLANATVVSGHDFNWRTVSYRQRNAATSSRGGFSGGGGGFGGGYGGGGS